MNGPHRTILELKYQKVYVADTKRNKNKKTEALMYGSNRRYKYCKNQQLHFIKSMMMVIRHIDETLRNITLNNIRGASRIIARISPCVAKRTG